MKEQKEIGAIFARAREKEGLSQAQLGKKAEKSQQHVDKVESGLNVTTETLVMLARALGYRLKITLEKKGSSDE